MKSTISHFNLLRTLKSHLRSYWWFALIVLLSMVFFGPIVVYSSLSQSAKEGMLTLAILDLLSGQAYFALYALAMLFGGIFALRLSFSQHKKQQIDHFHSLPIRRSQIMTLNYLTATILFAAVLAVIFLLTFIVFTIFMTPVPAMFTLALTHYLQILLFFILSFAVTMLAGQLTGHLLAQIAMAMLLHFGIPLFAFIVDNLFTSEWPTYVENAIIDKLYLWSLPSVFSKIIAHSQMMPVEDPQNVTLEAINQITMPWLPKGIFLCLILVGILTIALTYFLYNRRPLERGGQTFIYAKSAYPVKAYLIFVATLSGGLFTAMAINGGFLVFLISFLLVGVLTHIFCAIAFNRDVRSIGKGMISTLLFLALTFSFYLAVHADVIGFNNYTPEADQVTKIEMELSGSQMNNIVQIKERADINHAVALAKTAKENNLTDNDGDAYQRVTLNFVWHEKKGHPVSRRYTIDKTLMDKIYQPLYDSQTYREAYWKDILQMDPKEDTISLLFTPHSYGTPANDPRKAESTYLYERNDNAHSSAENADAAAELISALKHDLVARKFSDLNNQTVAYIDLEFRMAEDDDLRRSNYLIIRVLESDVHSRAVIEKLRTANLLPADINDLVLAETTSLRILEKDDPDILLDTANDIDPILGGKEVALITDPELIREIITEASVRIDQNEDIGIMTENRYVIDSPDNPYFFQRAFLKDRIPERALAEK